MTAWLNVYFILKLLAGEGVPTKSGYYINANIFREYNIRSDMFQFKKIFWTRLRFILTITAGFSLISTGVFSQEKGSNPSLSKLYPVEILKKILLPCEDIHPYPKSDERESWMSLSVEERLSYIARGEKALGFEWQVLPLSLFLDYFKTGNTNSYRNPQSERRTKLRDLVIAECMEGKGRFIDDIINGIWAICEESTWCVPARHSSHEIWRGLPNIEEPIVALFSAETAALLTWTVYLLGEQLDQVSPVIRLRVQQEEEKRILLPYLENNYRWMGFEGGRETPNNWNPWVNSNVLAVTLLLVQDEAHRIELLDKILRCLDRFIRPYPSDGSCDEGVSYWHHAAGSLLDCLELFSSATDGKIDIYNEPLIQEMGKYIYRVHINGRYFINFADTWADSALNINVAPGTLFQYGRKIGDKKLEALAAYAAADQRANEQQPDGILFGSIWRRLQSIFNLSELLKVEPSQPMFRDVWLRGIDVMAARSREGSAEGFYVAAKGGHNGQSHNHNDIGNFILFADGRPIIIDVGVEVYTKKTFSSERYDIWTMQSAYHNLPTINGVMQKEGKNFAARNVDYKSNESFAQLTVDIAGAYPPEAEVSSWIRTIRLNRDEDVRIIDSYTLNKPGRELTLSLMTPCRVAIDIPGQLTLMEAQPGSDRSPVKVFMKYDGDKLTPSVENISIKDPFLKSMWGDRITRIFLHTNEPKLRDTLKLLITR